MKIINLQVGPLDVNCYIVYDSVGGNAAVIDPGGDAQLIVAELKKNNLNVKYILLTHGHYDHISGVSELAEIVAADAYLHSADLELYAAQKSIIENIGGRELYKEFKNYELNKKYMLSDDLTFEVVHTPGHSAGSVCVVFLNEKNIFSGDTLFFESIGRTDLPGGDMSAIKNSLKKIINDFPDFNVFPGHGPKTSVDYENRNNHYINSFF